MSPPRLYGLGVPRSEFTPRRSVLAVDEQTTSGGNITVRVGRENPLRGTGWTKTEHVVITPDELSGLIDEFTALQATRCDKGSHLVTWAMEIPAATPREAAKRALEIHRNPESIATCFKVNGTTVIDFYEEGP